MTNLVATYPMEAQAMNIIRSAESRKLIGEAVRGDIDENLINVSFMLSPKQKAVIEQLAKENRFSQGVVLRVIIDEWMQSKATGNGNGK
jgi:hypothetical protein